ncbi:MAG: His-Xaa-Ser system protein HxsD [Alistipes sp.]|nr:His-Xaa-Ser system protein HxsD [Alistipes sp.]
MINSKVENNTLIIEVDTSIYCEAVICKTLYWLTSDFVICRSKGTDENIQRIELRLKNDILGYNWDSLVSDLSDKFIDYKNRQIILEETRNLRELYFAKAFANSDSFVEFNFND